MADPDKALPRIVIAAVAGVVVVAGVLLVVALADGGPEDGASAEGALGALPPWVDEVYPPPDAETSSVSAVEVDHQEPGAGEGVRLLIDGVDVTTYAAPGEGQLRYEPERGRGPVPLDAGPHEATLQLVQLPSYGDKHAVVDEFRWTFTIL